MGLSTGSRLGPYEILSALGAGGMGEATARAATRRILELINELKAEGLL